MRLTCNKNDINIADFDDHVNDSRRMQLAKEIAGENSNYKIINSINDRLPKFIPEGVSIVKNMQEASKMSAIELYRAVKTRGKWDYKQLEVFRLYQDFGNAHYAAVTRAWGIPDMIARIGAGFYQIASGTSPLRREIFGFNQWKSGMQPNVSVGLLSQIIDPNYGDDPIDQFHMKKTWEILDIMEQQNLDSIPESNTRLDAPKEDTKEKSD